MHRRGPHRETALQRFIDARGIAAAWLEAKLRERLQGRAPSRKQWGRWRLGRTDVQRKDMARILWAVRAVANDDAVRIEDIFELDPADPEVWLD